MTKFLDKSFSSRPASQEYRDNFDRTFDHPPVSCGGCADHDRETVHEFVCSFSGDGPDCNGLVCTCILCDGSKSSLLHKHMHVGG